MNEINKLKEGIVHTPGKELDFCLPIFWKEDPFFVPRVIPAKIREQHLKFLEILKKKGIKVIQLKDLINQGLSNAEKKEIEKYFGTGLKNSTDILGGGKNDFLNPSSILYPTKWLLFTRDLGTLINNNEIIVHNFVNFDRSFENLIFRFILETANNIGKIVFDSSQERVFSQGGDVIVLNEEIIAVGVGNLTEKKFAVKLSKKVENEIVTVSLPKSNFKRNGYSTFYNINEIFLHLDTLISVVDKNKILTIPFFLEQKYANNNPIYDILKTIRRKAYNFKKFDEFNRPIRYPSANEITALIKNLGEIGNIKIIKKGNVINSKLKFVDFLKDNGYEIVFAGKNTSNKFEKMFTALKEISQQACNVLTISPGDVVIYSQNKETIKNLKETNIKVNDFDGSELMKFLGGPHCLVLPTIRNNNYGGGMY